MSSEMARNRGLDAIASFYDELCPVRESEVQDADRDATARLTHDNIMGGVQIAMGRAMAAVGGGLGCRELDAMERMCGQGGDVLRQMQVATFHAYWHRFVALRSVQAWVGSVAEASPGRVAPDCDQAPLGRSMLHAALLQEQAGGTSKAGLKHLCTISWWIGLEEAYVRENFEAAAVWLEMALQASQELAGLRRGWCFHVRYALGCSLYYTAFHSCDGDTERQAALLETALTSLVACAREVAQQSEAVEDVSWALTAFGKAGKAGMKLQVDLSKVLEIYNDVVMYARKLGQDEWADVVSQLSSGVQELEEDKIVAALRLFVRVLEDGVRYTAVSDHLRGSFDLLSHACWWVDRSMRTLVFQHLTDRVLVHRLVKYVKACVAEGKMVLGEALRVLGREEEGLPYLESVHRLLEDDPSHPSLHQVQTALARAYAEGRTAVDDRRSAEMYEAAAKTARDLETQVEMNMAAGSQLVKVPQQFATGVEKMKAAVRMASEGLPHKWELRASLLFRSGVDRLLAGDFEGGVEQMEAGRNLCAANAFAFDPQEEGYVREIVQGLAALLLEYSRKENLAPALALYKDVDPVLANLRSTVGESPLWIDTAWRNWQQAQEDLIKATGYPVDAVVEKCSARLSWDPEILVKEDVGGGSTYLIPVVGYYEELVDTKCEEGDWAGAVDAWNDLEEKLLERGVLRKTAKVKLHLNRARVWSRANLLPRALEEIQRAEELILDAEKVPGLVAKVYLEQADVCLGLQDPDTALSSLDKAAKSLTNGKDEDFRDIQVFRAALLKKAGKFEEAAQLTREVALLYVDAQSNLGMESVWIPFLDGTGMTGAFRKTEILYRVQKDIPKALIWSERGRARLFMHRAKLLEAQKFDVNDEFAEDVLYETIELCGPGTVIIECSIHQGNIAILYGLSDHRVSGRVCTSKALHLDEFFSIEANCVAGKSIEEVVHKVRGHIHKGKDEQAIPGLTVLHSLLVHSILDRFQQVLGHCTSIIFAPQGVLHLIPFAALYDGCAKKFLIEQKTVGVIPSIRVLHRCFMRQQMLEDNFRARDLAFVAGNPEPMGLERLGLKQLPGAAREAQQVAEILGVEACKGENITKGAVVRALKNSSVVLLATHGLTEPDGCPRGAVVLRGSSISGGLPSEQEDLLTFDEIASLDGGIGAGLVALSACHTGLGEISNEGILGLGHAVLQAGAASALVALWDVDDDATGILIADIFRELKKGTDVLHAVQKAMVDMLGHPEHRQLHHWSALTALGSPIFRLPCHTRFGELNPKEDCLDSYYWGSQLSAEDIGGKTMYLRAVVRFYQDWAWQREQEGDYADAIATVDWLEQRLQERGLLVTAVAKSKLHLWRSKYMNHSQDGSRHALKEMQKAVEVLPDIETTPELAAEIFLEQAKAHLTLRDRKATSAALDKAQRYVAKSTDKILPYHIGVVRTLALSDAGEFQAAAALARETQLGAGLGQQSVWVPFVDDEALRNTLCLFEIGSMEQQEVNKAIVWAERGRTSVSGDDGTFDGSDNVAVQSMLTTKALCGPDTLIIFVSYHHRNTLLLYGLHDTRSAVTRVRMKKIFKEQANCVMGSSLEELVARVRHHICRGEDETAIPGLSILYNLFVNTVVEEYKGVFSSSTSIIFAPQGFVCQIPFAALYDSSSRKFLVEQHAVGVIPSLRALRRCFSRQETFEAGCKDKENACFVAGNPEPMGLSLEQLPGAGRAAKEVSGVLNVEACPGSSITKQVLLDALSTHGIVMLATQGVGGRREQPYPYGAVVVKQAPATQDQVLSCEEIAGLEGNVNAGLVVLAACHEGDGEVASSKDGLLGVGHAVLEAGAVSVVATLWDMSDSSLDVLISAVFRELKAGSDVLHSVQKAMADSSRTSQIRHWASLTVLGSPTLRISGDRSEQHARAQDGPIPINFHTLQQSCLGWFDVNTDDGPTTLDTLPPATAHKVLQYLEQQRVTRLQRAQQDGDLQGQIIGGRDLGMVYGAMGEWMTSRQSFVGSIRVAHDNWELVKTDRDAVSTLPLSGLYVASVIRLYGSASGTDLSLARFVLRSSDPTNGLLPMIRQLLAVWD